MSNAELSEVVITQFREATMFPVSHVLDQLTAYDPELEDIKTRVLAAITRIHINEKSKK
jgi:cytochrome c oxidase assembly protein Cox11